MAGSNKKVTVGIYGDTKNFRVEVEKATKSISDFRKKTEKTHGSGGKLADMFRRMANQAGVLHGPLSGVSGRLSAMATLLSRSNVGWAAFGTTVSGVTAAFVKGAKDLAHFEHQLARLEGVFQATDFAAGKTTAQVHEFARALALDTLTDTSTVLTAAAQLGTFTTITGDTFDRTLRLGQDMAEVMGTQLPGAAMQLAKALDNPLLGLNSLRRAGVSFSEQQKAMIQDLAETGRLFEAQDLILDAVESQLQGVAAAVAANTKVGAWDTFTQRVQEFSMALASASKESDTFLKVFGGVNDFLEDAAKALDPDLMSTDEIASKLAELDKIVRDFEKRGVQPGGWNPLSDGRRLEGAIAQRDKFYKLLQQRHQEWLDGQEAAQKESDSREAQRLEQRLMYLIAHNAEVEKAVLSQQQKIASLRATTAGVDDDPYAQAEATKERQEAALQADMEAMDKRVRATEEIQILFEERRLAILDQYRARRAEIEQEEYDERVERVREANLEILAAHREEQEALEDMRRTSLAGLGNFFSAAGQMMREGSKEQRAMAVFQKSIAITQATINMFKAMSDGLATGATPIDKAIFAAGIAAQGATILAQLAAVPIAAGRASGGPVLPGANYLVGEHGPEILSMGTRAGTVVPNGSTSTQPNVNVNIIEDASRGGQVDQEGESIQVYVAAAMSHLSEEFNSGRGLFAAMENKYGLAR